VRLEGIGNREQGIANKDTPASGSRPSPQFLAIPYSLFPIP
jgi:hypothetical protein